MAEIATFRKTGWLPTFGLTEGQYYYMMRNEESCDVLTSEDWLHLRGALRCEVVVQDAMHRPLRNAIRAGCICAVRCAARALHLRGVRWLQLQAQNLWFLSRPTQNPADCS